ncbi:MAG: IPT/TIG domain-containing protein, partial [Cyclobacteriaceae bacterium]|nr:IPT/TIG domain-containing protein [Cyclobacteriaceae bacterium]
QGKSTSQVTINGANFNPIAANQIVTFGNRVAEVLGATSNQLIVKLPTSLIDSEVNIRIDVAEQSIISNQLFHLISPWKRLTNYPGGNTGDATAFAIGNYGYLGLGKETPTFTKRIWKYDPTFGTWTQATTFFFPNEGTGSPFINMNSFVDGTFAYVGLGSQGGWPQGPEGRVRKYDPSSNTWTNITGIGNNPSAYRTDGAVSYSINGKGYITTGRENGNATSFKMWEYNPTSDTWARKKDLPSLSRWEATGFSINSKLYLLGGSPCIGCGSSSILKDVWEYDVFTDNWTQLPDFPGGRLWMSTGFSINGVGYVIGGFAGSMDNINMLSDIWKFESSNNTWIHLEDFPGGKIAAGTVFVINGKAYYGTGLKDGVGYSSDFWEFDPTKL